MAKSLRDQLIKAGAANVDKQNKRGRKKKTPKAAKKDRAPGSMSAQDCAPNSAQIRARQQAERDRELNRQRQQQLQQRELVAQIRQLIERNSIDQNQQSSKNEDDRDGNERLDYNFSDSGVVRRLSLPSKLHRRVVIGTIAIASLDDSYHLIPRPVADKISERDSSYLVVMNDDEAGEADKLKPNEDDEYAQFEVPDDLMW